MGNPKVSVVITGFEAKYYDALLDVLTLFQYARFVKNMLLSETCVNSKSRVAELGVGNGRNAIFLSQIAKEIVGFDISQDMLKKAKLKTAKYENIKIVRHNILEPFSDKYGQYFDVALISLAFHGFKDHDKDKIFENVREVLRNGGKFYIFDYNQMDYAKAPLYFKILIDKFECPLAEEFLSYPLEENASEHGFKLTKKREYVKGLFQYTEFTLTE